MTRKRILPANLPAYYIPIEVTSPWTSGLNVAKDIELSTGFPITGVPVTIIYDLYFELWDGYDDASNFASLKFDVSVPEYVFKDIMGNSTPFSTALTIGDIAYLLMTRVKK